MYKKAFSIAESLALFIAAGGLLVTCIIVKPDVKFTLIAAVVMLYATYSLIKSILMKIR